MKTFRLFLVVFSLLGAFSPHVGHAFSITSASLAPGSTVPPGVQLQMTVNLTTPGQPPFLYAPTQVYSNSTGIHVDIYPSSGALTAIGQLTETVTLGSFPPGTYTYQVVLYPDPNYGPVGGGVRTNRGTFTVQSEPALPTVGLSPYGSTAEPCPTCLVAPAVILISRSDPTNAPLTVTLADGRGTATPGSDYERPPATFTIPAGQRTAELRLLPLDDQLVEGPEVARIRLVSSANYQIRPAGGESLITIYDDEPNAPTARLDIISPSNEFRSLLGRTLELSALAVNVSNEVYGPVEFYAGDQLVARSPIVATARPAVPGIASIHAAYWTNPPVGQHALTARTQLSFNNWITSPPVNVTIESPPGPVVRLETSPPQNPHAPEFCPVTADCAYPSFVVRRSGSTNAELRVYLSYSGTATRGADYPEPPSSVVIPAGRDAASVMLVPTDDSLVEGPETVIARFTPIPAPLYFEDPTASSATITIIDNDSAPPRTVVSIVAEDPIATEFPEVAIPEIRPDTARFRISRNGDLSREERVFFSIGGSTTYGEDYYFTSPFSTSTPPGSALIPAGAESVALQVFAREDNKVEGTETILIQLEPSPMMNPLPSYEIDPVHDRAEATIIDRNDQGPLPTVRIDTVSRIAEENTGPLDRIPRRGEFRISRDGPTTNALPVSVLYQGTATSGSDYQTLPMLVTIPAGTNSALLTVSAIPDDLPEGIETVVARVFDCLLVGAPIPCEPFNIDPAHASATVFIVDNPETEAGLTITRPSNGAVFDPDQTILIEATAVDLEGYISRVEFRDGENRIGVSEITFIVPPDPGTPIHHSFQWNAASHGPHVLTARATRADGSALRSAPVSITVRGDPPPAMMRIDATSPIAEETSEPFRRLPLVGVFTVSRTGPTNEAMSAFVLWSGTASNGVDYPQQPWFVTIPAGAASTEIRIAATPDQVAEGIETVVAELSVCPPATDPPMGIPCFFVPIDPAHNRATVFIRDNGSTEATLTINRPANGTTFNPGQTISIEATAVDPNGYIGYVEFFAGNQRIGVSNIQFVQPPPDGMPITHHFDWRNAPPGQPVLTARATVTVPGTGTEPPMSYTITSPPVNITVLGEPPGDRELHVVGVYSGTVADGGTSHSNEVGNAAVHVNRPGERVTLVLSAYEPVVWHLTVGNATIVDRIILGGYYAQKVEGVGSDVQITDLTYPNNPGNYLYVGYSLDCPEVYRAFDKIRALTGLEISSFHGGYQASWPEPTAIDSVQDDPRLRADYPVPAPRSELPNLEFQLSFYQRGSGGDVFTRRYTLAGPQEDSRLLPATRVIRDAGNRYYYGLQWHEPFRVDTETDTEQSFGPPATLPELSWPWGLTYDPQRNRILLVSFGGEGYLYGYAPNTEQWSLVRSMNNLDIESLEYHAADNSLYALTVFGSQCGSPSVVKLTPDGQVQSQFPLNLQGYGLSLGLHTTELVSVGEYLVLLLEPSHPNSYEQTESRIYLIDPRTGQSRLTYRSKAGDPANQAPYIAIVQPAEGTEFPPSTAVEIAAQTTDSDGYVRMVEFFVDGRKIGEQTLEFSPPAGQPQRFSFTWRDPAPGSHVLTARATDDDDASALSGAVTIRVAMSNAVPVVNVYAPDSYAAEPSASAVAVLDTASFRIVRSGLTNASLTVPYTLFGTAQNGVDYEQLTGSATIPAGRRSVEVLVRPLTDNLAEEIESVVLQLEDLPTAGPVPRYTIGTHRRAAAVIADADPSVVARDASCTAVAGGLHITFRASSGRNYRIEGSTDLVNWETVSTTTATDDAVHYVETDPSNFSRRFYRVVPEPMPLSADY